MPHAGDHFIHLVAGQLSTFAGFRALGDFDLQLVGVGQVGGRYAESSGSDLLNG